jgi:ElaA protein
MTYQWQISEFAELSNSALYDLLRLRQQVFVVEQGINYVDADGLDQRAVHMLCREDGELLAYQRCLEPGAYYSESAMGRITVSAPARGRGLGRELVRRGIEHNLRRWPQQDIRINAQAYLEGFYHALGFMTQGDVFEDKGVPHIQMLYARSA